VAVVAFSSAKVAVVVPGEFSRSAFYIRCSNGPRVFP
jgi:hypothetical protein